jgi:hypothetical protein
MADAVSAPNGQSPELELPDISEVAPGYSATGFPEDFSAVRRSAAAFGDFWWGRPYLSWTLRR